MKRAEVASCCVSFVLLALAGPLLAQAGAPLGGELRVNTYTTDTQGRPSVAADSSGSFVVVWHSAYQDGSTYGIFGQRYESTARVRLRRLFVGFADNGTLRF